MARARPKAETNFQYCRVKHLVHYINLTPFIRNNTHIHNITRRRAKNEWRKTRGKNTHTRTICITTSSCQINRLTYNKQSSAINHCVRVN